MKYLVISSHDERYDFNFEFTTTNDEIEEYLENNCVNLSHFEREDIGGIIKYSEIHRSKLDGQIPDISDKINEKVEVIHFHIFYFIPVDFINNESYADDGFIFKNLKFGILDLKNWNRIFKKRRK